MAFVLRLTAYLACVVGSQIIAHAAHANPKNYDYTVELRSKDFVPDSPVVMRCREGTFCWAQFELKIDDETKTVTVGAVGNQGNLHIKFAAGNMPLFVKSEPYANILVSPSSPSRKDVLLTEPTPTALEDWRSGRAVIRGGVRALAVISVDVTARDATSSITP